MTTNKKTKWPEGPVKLIDEDFDGFVKTYPNAVVDCWADWCGPCRMMGPVIDTLARDHAGKIAFGKLDVDENEKVADRYDVRAIPTFLVFRDGGLVLSSAGAMGKSELDAMVLKALSKG